MTASIGYDEYWDSGGKYLVSSSPVSTNLVVSQVGAVHSDVAAKSLIEFIPTITPEMNGQFWAPRGGRDIGESKRVMGEDVPQSSPIQLPW